MNRQNALAEGKRLESEQRVDDAVRAYVLGGSLADAVRVLVGVRRYDDAGELVMRALRTADDDVHALTGQKRSLAHRAATYFSHGRQRERALALFTALGDAASAARLSSSEMPAPSSIPPRPSNVHERRRTQPPRSTPAPSRGSNPGPAPGSGTARNAVHIARSLEQEGAIEMARDAYVRLKMFADAARLTHRMGDVLAAAGHYRDGGLPYEAAICYLEVEDSGEALGQLVHVPRDHEHYRKACVRAIGLARELNALDFEVDRFLSRFVRSGPEGVDELAAFYELGRLYEDHEFAPSACEVYQQISRVDADYLDVADRLADLDADSRASEMVFEKINREERAFRDAGRRRVAPRDGVLPDLPDLPGLPPLPTDVDVGANDRRLVTSVRRSLGRGEASTAPPPNAVASADAPAQIHERERGHDTAPAAGAADRSSDRPSKPGEELIAGRYKVRRLLGEGGMASVYEAMDVELGIPIALKLFTCAETETLVSRFKRELMLARELTHDNIVRVYDIGTHRGQRFMTMELMQGADLRDHMDGPMDQGVARQYLEQACVGLHAAHLRGVIHRDIKPENFFVMHDGRVKVMDFGIAKKATTTSNLTAEGFTAGTPAYMAPEQIRDFGRVTHQCDVYALGVIAYEMLTGELPFYHDEAMKLMMMHLHDAPPLPSEYVQTISAGVERVILHALEKHPKDRIKSCAEFADRLAEAFDANE